MPDVQLGFSFAQAPALSPVPHLRDEIARIWGLPLGEHVEIAILRGPCDSLRGRLDLRQAPDLPLNPRQPLTLSVNGVIFSSRDIGRWKIV